MAWQTRQPKGQRVEDKLQFARDMLSLYGTPDEKAAVAHFRKST